MRLFLGIELPEPLVGEIGRVQSLLRASRADVRWVDPASAHLTLKFLGQVEKARVAEIDAALRAPVGAAIPHVLDVVGIGAFPNEARPRVLWAGVEGAVHELGALQQGIETSLESLGVARENRRYSPHVTLGRVRRPLHLQALAAAIGELRHEPLGTVAVTEVVLFESTLTPRGARYEARSRYRLTG